MTIKITHSRREGTLIRGAVRGDGSADVLKLRQWGATLRQGAKWSRTLGCWYLPFSRDKATYKPNLEQLAALLHGKGLEVTLTIDEDDRRTFTEQEEDRIERAADRAERFDGYADNAASRSQAAYEGAHRIADRIPFGQPTQREHHSTRRTERDRERIHSGMDRSIREGDKASYWSDRTRAAEAYETFRKNPGRTLRRIATLGADLRAVEKWQRGESAKGFARNPDDPELPRMHQDLTEQIEFWQKVIEEAEKKGYKVWSKADFSKGDFVLNRGRWFEVLRVNAKSVTIPHIHNGIGQKVVRAEGNRLDWTWKVPYDEVSGRKSALEMAQHLEQSAA
ncbi:DUF3560 domain-containing protein [Streptomyces sp. NPDC059999]|uniref:DUF3560 domain-containing protein n=1 Tax=Streptomyces sp. NPDC059999 TaxID=3347030 RepID=UPI0036925161